VDVGLSIFYFDDEPQCLRLFSEAYGTAYEVHTAQTLAEARRALTAHRPDIIICDQNMPEIRGVEFLADVAALCPSSFRVLLTGTMMVGDALRELGSGTIHLFLPKPWTESSIHQMLARAALHLQSRLRAAGR